MIFSLVLIFSTFSAYGIDEAVQPALYSYYGNNMLFRQNNEAIFAGKAAAGSKITCTVTDSQGKEFAKSETTAKNDNTFSLSFMAPKGSFEEYTAVLSTDSVVFAELKGIVFGELWLAGGQSNMHWTLIATAEGYDMAYNNRRGSSSIRILYTPHPGTYKGDANKVPAYPMTDYESGAGWYKGDDPAIYSMTAIGYFFAENMLAELNVPIGIIDANLGGTSILTWLPRNAIESNAQILADCKSENRYIPLQSWNESNINFGTDMTANFNKIISPLRNFRLSGMLWYQGEGDVYWSYGRYSRAFNALQDAYTAHFSYTDGSLPIVFTQLASYTYGSLDLLQNTNAEFSHIQQQRPDSRALTSILDTPHTYTLETHAIHPYYKKQISEKMAYAAKGLVYGLHDSYTTATVSDVQIKDGSVYVSFRDVADKLISEGDTLSAFSICGSDGVYVSAKAEIVSDNTVRIYSPSVPNPKSATYAYSQSNLHANLFASRNGEKLLAVSPFITDMSFNRHHWHNDFWASCDFESFWHCHTNEYTGFYNTWNSTGAKLKFVKSDIDAGNALSVTSKSAGAFTVSPNFLYNENGHDVHFQDVDYNWSDYGTLSFTYKINPGKPVRLDGLKITVNGSLWVTPALAGHNAVATDLVADGKTYTVTFDLNRLYPYGNAGAEPFTKDILTVVPGAEFIFTASGSDTELTLDNFSFSSDVLPPVESTNPSEPAPKLSFFEKIKAFFDSLFAKITLFFKNLF